MKMDEKMYTGQNRILHEIPIKYTFKLPTRKENTPGVVQLLRVGTS
jgi:hypothetical protein